MTKGRALVGVLLIVGAVVVSVVWALPNRVLLPTGPRAITTDAWVWTERQRQDLLADVPGPRRLPVQAWYPTDGDLGPVVVFVHGSMGRREGYLSWLRQLASHGYVVVAADHPPVAFRPNFPDNSSAPTSSRWSEAVDTLREPEDLAASEAFQLAQRMVRDDVRLILERLPQVLDVDVDRVVLAGHSFGGGVAMSECAVDPRCTAVINLDGPPEGTQPPPVIAVPFLVITTGQARLHPGFAALMQPLSAVMDAATGPVYAFDLPDAGHLDLSDLPLLARPTLLRRFLGPSQIGRGDVDAQLRASATVSLAFLDRHVRGRDEADPVEAARASGVMVARSTAPADD